MRAERIWKPSALLLLKSWKDSCESWQNNTTLKARGKLRNVPPNLRVIGGQHYHLTEASEVSRYAALSYMWRDITVSRATRNKLRDFHTYGTFTLRSADSRKLSAMK